jgi:plasmid replication initiation protein
MAVSKPKKDHLPLTAEKHGQGDLFVFDVADAVLKDIMPEMEHPFYSLSKKPEMTLRRYEHNGNWLEIIPSYIGLATIYDKDILIYCISKLMQALKNGEPIGPRVRITAYDLLRFTNRGTSGRDYKSLSQAIDRLSGTRIKTNIRTGDEEQEDTFGLIDAATLRRKHGLDGRLLWVDVRLSTWVMNAVQAQEVLTLHRDYFRLGKPIERRIYELARKHCGRQASWAVSVAMLLKKCGSQGPLKLFRHTLKNVAKHNHLPDYQVTFDNENDQVIFHRREAWVEKTDSPPAVADLSALPTSTYEEARQAAPGYDVYQLEQEWRDWWVSSGRPKLESPAAAFVGFCASRHKRAPLQRGG